LLSGASRNSSSETVAPHGAARGERLAGKPSPISNGSPGIQIRAAHLSAKKNGSREGLRLPSASPLLGIEASGTVHHNGSSCEPFNPGVMSPLTLRGTLVLDTSSSAKTHR
jgi:hypothetical protein